MELMGTIAWRDKSDDGKPTITTWVRFSLKHESQIILHKFSPLWQYIARASLDMQRDQMSCCIDHIYLLLQEDSKPTITTYVHFSCQSFKHEFQIILDKQKMAINMKTYIEKWT